MSHWRLLDEEVARWRDLGRTAELWWRDDDAVDATPELDRLLQLHGASAEPGVDVLQHGYAHVNHALPPAKKIELGAERPAMLVLGELGTGWLALERICAGRALPVLVPPWNRIAPALVPALPEIGFKGLSTFGEVRRTEPVRGLRQVNTHVDVIDWKAGRGFVGEDAAIFSLVQALAAARAGTGGPVGVLSHHLAMDEPAWNFLMFLWARAKEMSGIQFRPARELFGTGEARA
jgi:peptidoglycan/xylan/chitin deacetylase (PgdA/CDA1 family)